MAKITKSIFSDTDIRTIPINRTPTAETVCAFITEPSTEYDDDGQFFIRIRLKTASKECKSLIAAIDDARDKAYKQAEEKLTTPKERNALKMADTSYKEEQNDDGEKKSVTLPIFDIYGKPVQTEGLDIWSGSLVSVAYRLVPFYTAQLGVGVSHRIEAVQLNKLVSGGGKSAADYGFAVEDEAEDDLPPETMPDSGDNGDY